MELIQPMLAETVADRKAAKRFTSDDWYLQQKVDGVRVVTHVIDGKVIGLKRSGTLCDFTGAVHQALEPLRAGGSWVLDGELVSNRLFLFDFPYAEMNGRVMVDTDVPFEMRMDVLTEFMPLIVDNGAISVLETARTLDEKNSLLTALKEHGAEGVMLKQKDAAYYPGKRSDKIVKVKFQKTAECIILRTGIDGKDNAELGMVDSSGRIVHVGKCSMIGKPGTDGDIVEVRYLYAVDKDRPRLYQPTLLRVRDDKVAGDCTLDQIEFTNKTVLVR